jgi:hypothetical protein
MHGRLELHFDGDSKITNTTFNEIKPTTYQTKLGKKKFTWTFASSKGAIRTLSTILEELNQLYNQR